MFLFTLISRCRPLSQQPGLASRSCYTLGIISDFHGGGKQKMAAGLSYIRAVRLRHITTAGPGFGYSRGYSGFLSPASVISFPSVSCFQMIWDERLFYILSPRPGGKKVIRDHKYSHNDNVVTLRMIKFMLMMMIILILMETSTTIGLMETFPSDTKEPSIIFKSSSETVLHRIFLHLETFVTRWKKCII